METKERLIYPLELIKTGISFLFNTRFSRRGFDYDKEKMYEPIRSMIVYTLRETHQGYLPLNREYKPIGISYYDNYVCYESYEFLLIPKQKVKIENIPEYKPGNQIYFFDDATFPKEKKTKERYLKVIKEAFPDLND